MAKEKIRLDPIDRDIIRTIVPLKLAVTPSKIAKTINVHPATVQSRLGKLDKAGITNCKKEGKHKMMKCRINPNWREKVRIL
ncbi:hypothetical protein J4225_01320 [Candidatus Pacearchaeota archaeon]|nr:hypothetical protein [Candidatus Pacearchaeota archaeon]